MEESIIKNEKAREEIINVINKGQTQEEIIKEIKEIIKEIIRLDNKRFERANKKMLIAEKKLVETFNQEQLVLYEDFCKKREKFYKAADEVYKKRYDID